MIDKQSAICALRAKLSNKCASTGSWLQIPSSATAEIMACSGYEWLAVDLEHGSFSLSQLPDIFRSIELYNCIPFARVRSQSFDHLQSVLDAGAAGLIVPNVNSLEDINHIYDFVNWPPRGRRGVGFSRANMYGRNFSYFNNFNQSIFTVAMIENFKAVENLPSILSSGKVDAILIGPYDLSASLGMTSQFDSPRFKSALNSIQNLCHDHKVPCGFHVVENSADVLQAKIDNGYLFNAFSIDSYFLANSSSNPQS